METAKVLQHKNESRIVIYCSSNSPLENQVKNTIGRKWSATLRAWHVPNNEANTIAFLKKDFVAPLINKENDTTKTEIKTEKETPLKISFAVNELRRWMKSTRYSDNTIETYCDALKQFLVYHKTIEISEITNQHLINFNNDYILKNKLSASYQNQIINAIKLYFIRIENKKLSIENIFIPLPPGGIAPLDLRSHVDQHRTVEAEAFKEASRTELLVLVNPALVRQDQPATVAARRGKLAAQQRNACQTHLRHVTGTRRERIPAGSPLCVGSNARTGRQCAVLLQHHVAHRRRRCTASELGIE